MDMTEELNKLPNDNIRTNLIKIIENRFKYKKYKISIESGSSKGDNYIGVILRAEIQCLDNDDTNNNTNDVKKRNTSSVIVKTPPQHTIRREQFFARPTFLRESMMYNEFLPRLMNFQRSRGINPDMEGFHEFPENYACVTDDLYEGVFLRDLKQDGFVMWDRLKDISIEHVLLVMQVLGKYHGTVFAFKELCPGSFAAYKDLSDIICDRDEDKNLLQYFDMLIDKAKKALHSDDDKEILDRINQYFANSTFMEKTKQLVRGKQSEPYAVLCHGDCWNNNMLFKYERKTPVDIRLIDWQIARYASPICDISYYIFSCTTKELRDEHYDNIINTYYNSLSEQIERLGLSADKIFSRDAFDEELKKFGSFGFIMALMLLPIITTVAEDIPDLDEMSEKLDRGDFNEEDTFNSSRTKADYEKRMRDVTKDMIRLGYL